MKFNISFTLFLLVVSLSACGPDLTPVTNPVSDKATTSKEMDISELETNPNKNLYWGDLHVHTSLSIDAYIGGCIASCEDAYRYARGESINIFGRDVKLREPLDFCAVTDHSEVMGEMYSIITEGAEGHKSLVAWYLRSIYNTDSELGVDTAKQRKIFNRVIEKAVDTSRNHLPFFEGYETTMKAWDITIDAAENNYKPGEFTTFAGFEWTLADGEAHLHRNIIFRDMILPDYPLSSLETRNEKTLWKWLEGLENEGATVMAIPHNTNLAEGRAFTGNDWKGDSMTAEYAQLQQDFERLVEVHQVKGNSEVHAAFWKNDEFADFEGHYTGKLSRNNYVRQGLKKGLEMNQKLGVNPYKMGMIGSTDTHSATPGNTEEDDKEIGNKGILDIDPMNRNKADWALDMSQKTHEVVNPGGLVAVWSEANTREHVYDALERREVYATSGNRIELRFFGGSGFDQSLTGNDMVESGYANGVPMGQDLKVTGKKPQFLVWAKKAKYGANLDRIQIIKGWADKDGTIYEEIFDVALSENRLDDGQEAVNLETGEWNRNHGSDELKVIWTDQDFNSDQPSFYYVRVLEVPTGTWRLMDQIRYDIDYSNHRNLIANERAWSSPIWYSPN